MTVYELIQRLTKYEGDTEVGFHVQAEFSTDVEAEFDREDENNTQKVTVDAIFDEDVDLTTLMILENKRYIVINLEY
jgi:hypothetical protein